jgi:hypothetical protein
MNTQLTMPTPSARRHKAGRFFLETTYQAILHLRQQGWEIRRRGKSTHSARRGAQYMDRLDDFELRWLARQNGWEKGGKVAPPEVVTVLVEFPGYWADGRIMRAYRDNVPVRNGTTIPCWILLDEDRSEFFGIHASQARHIEGDA